LLRKPLKLTTDKWEMVPFLLFSSVNTGDGGGGLDEVVVELLRTAKSQVPSVRRRVSYDILMFLRSWYASRNISHMIFFHTNVKKWIKLYGKENIPMLFQIYTINIINLLYNIMVCSSVRISPQKKMIC
jgi:hypothetical protein